MIQHTVAYLDRNDCGLPMREKCPNTMFGLSVFSRIRTEYGEIPCIQVSLRIQFEYGENKAQKKLRI